MRRPRRTRDDVRQLLLESALIEFGAKGFAGASTRSIAQRVDAYQPQINYHFDSKEALWEAAVDHLFGLLEEALGEVPTPSGPEDPTVLAATTADAIRLFVRFAAAHPELNQIMVHEATAETERLRYMVERHIRPLYDSIRDTFEILRAAGIAAPIDPTMAHYVIVGSASMPYVAAPEVRLLTGVEPSDPAWVERHADGIVAMLLPGLTTGVHRASRRRTPQPTSTASKPPRAARSAASVSRP